MNHGKCKNCWWYKMEQSFSCHLERNSSSDTTEGVCYMQTVNPATDTEVPQYVKSDSWCPDYINRVKNNKRDKLTLNDWLEIIRKNCHTIGATVVAPSDFQSESHQRPK